MAQAKDMELQQLKRKMATWEGDLNTLQNKEKDLQVSPQSTQPQALCMHGSIAFEAVPFTCRTDLDIPVVAQECYRGNRGVPVFGKTGSLDSPCTAT